MRTVRYTILPGIGTGEFSKTGTLADLVRKVPYLVVDFLPPMRVLNEALRSGERDAGMSGGCRWEPLEVLEVEYEELTAALGLCRPRALRIGYRARETGTF